MSSFEVLADVSARALAVASSGSSAVLSQLGSAAAGVLAPALHYSQLLEQSVGKQLILKTHFDAYRSFDEQLGAFGKVRTLQDSKLCPQGVLRLGSGRGAPDYCIFIWHEWARVPLF